LRLNGQMGMGFRVDRIDHLAAHSHFRGFMATLCKPLLAAIVVLAFFYSTTFMMSYILVLVLLDTVFLHLWGFIAALRR
jgi:hypothetical protein